MTKVREIIEIQGWLSGNSWAGKQTISNQIIDVSDEMLAPDAVMDWSWWIDYCDGDMTIPDGWDDMEITVTYSPADCDDIYDPDVINTWSVRQSEI